METAQILNSPPPDTARKILIQTQTAITQIKELIIKSVADSEEQKITTSALNKMISDYCKTINDNALREESRKSLVSAARKWFYQINETMKIANQNIKTAAGDTYNIAVLSDRLATNRKYVETFRNITRSGQNPAAPLIRDYNKTVKLAIKALAAEPPKVVMISRGTAAGKTYIMPLRNRAEMAIRYEYNIQDLNNFANKGVKLVWTSSHPNCSPRCSHYQGRLWSLDGTTGIKNGIRYRPIQEALAGPLGDGNGIISGYNCRHTLSEYNDGSTAPQAFSKAEINKEYAIDKKQRAYENSIRQMKTEERLLRDMGYEKDASFLRKKWRVAQANYQAYSLQNGRAYYPYRYIIDEAETI